MGHSHIQSIKRVRPYQAVNIQLWDSTRCNQRANQKASPIYDDMIIQCSVYSGRKEQGFYMIIL